MHSTRRVWGLLFRVSRNSLLIMCISTIWIRKYQQEVPCGRCYECVKRRRNDWYIRCLIESRDRKYTYFGLLTYAEVGQSLEKQDVQLFLKRLRSYGYKFKYLIAGEHGEQKDRPHWHCLFFSDEMINYRLVAKAWRGGYKTKDKNIMGWIRFEPIRSARSIRYTVKYLYKYDGVDPRFKLMVSKNPAIGKSFLRYQVLFLTKRSATFTMDGRFMAMPRYYKRKIFDDYPDIKEEVNSVLAAKVAELAEREMQVAKALNPEATLKSIRQSKEKYNEQIRKSEKSSRHIRKAFIPS